MCNISARKGTMLVFNVNHNGNKLLKYLKFTLLKPVDTLRQSFSCHGSHFHVGYVQYQRISFNNHFRG